MITLPTYVTREQLAAALDVSPTGPEAAQLDRAVDAGSRSVETLCRRVFWPRVATRTFDWPAPGITTPAYRLYLDEDELADAPTAITAGGVTIATGDALPGPDDTGPPYGWLDLSQASSAAYSAGNTWQQAIAITGTFAGAAVRTRTVGELSAAADSSTTGLQVDAAAAAAVGLGDLLLLGTERVLVTGRTWVDTSVNVTLTDDSADQTFTAADVVEGERLLVGGERMLAVDVAGTSVTVRRAVDGTTLAAHTAADLYASRSLIVERGYGGTTAAAHSDEADVAVHVWPALVVELALAEALVAKVQQGGAYARPQGSGSGTRQVASGTLDDVRARCAAEHRRYRDAAI